MVNAQWEAERQHGRELQDLNCHLPLSDRETAQERVTRRSQSVFPVVLSARAGQPCSHGSRETRAYRS